MPLFFSAGPLVPPSLGRSHWLCGWLTGIMCLTGASLTGHAAEAGVPLADLQHEVAELAATTSERVTRQRLIAIDDELSEQAAPGVAQLRGEILRLLAETSDDDALQYIRSIFENETEMRDEAAHALSIEAYRAPVDLQDWRFLIRSLTVVEAEQAIAVMKALSRYRQRATNSHWIRRVILLGLTFPEDQRPVALNLLGHWTGEKDARPDWAAQADLAAYQDWFAQKWPQEQPAVWPTEAADLRWPRGRVRELLDTATFSPEQVTSGQQVYTKANCAKCHVKGSIGQKQGPELSDIAGARQRKELLEAIVFPSLELHEDYPTVNVVTQAGQVYSGLMSTTPDGGILILDPDGKTREVARSEIEQISPNPVSNMPAGLLEPLSRDEILALFAFLEFRENPTKPYHGLE